MRVLLPLLLALSGVAHSAELAGVTMPDTVSLGGQSLVLNGQGLREKYFIDIYVGGLYLPAPTTSADRAIQDDVPKRISMEFIYKEVTRQQMVDTFREGLAKNPDAASLRDRFTRLEDFLGPARSGDSVLIDYVPGKGTTFTFNGVPKGTIEGADFMQAIWVIYLGPNPPTEKLKRGLLGG